MAASKTWAVTPHAIEDTLRQVGEMGVTCLPLIGIKDEEQSSMQFWPPPPHGATSRRTACAKRGDDHVELLTEVTEARESPDDSEPTEHAEDALDASSADGADAEDEGDTFMEEIAGGGEAMLQAFEENTIFQTTAGDHLAPSAPDTRDQAQNINATANSSSDPQPPHGLVPAALAKLVPRSRAAPTQVPVI